MPINPISPLSFKGTLSRQNCITYDNKGRAKWYEASRDDFLKSYDAPIAQLQKAKEDAVEIDNLMFGDSDIQETIKRFPDDVDIVLHTCLKFTVEDGKINPSAPYLSVFKDMHNVNIYSFNQKAKMEGKAGVIKWLNKLLARNEYRH